MDRFDDETLAMFMDLEKVRCVPGLKDFAAWGRKLYAEGQAEAESRLRGNHSTSGQAQFDELRHKLEEAEAKLAQAEAANSKLIEALNGSEHMLQGKEAELLDLQTKYEALVPDRDQAEALAFCVEKKCGELRAQNAALTAELAKLRKV